MSPGNFRISFLSLGLAGLAGLAGQVGWWAGGLGGLGGLGGKSNLFHFQAGQAGLAGQAGRSPTHTRTHARTQKPSGGPGCPKMIKKSVPIQHAWNHFGAISEPNNIWRHLGL